MSMSVQLLASLLSQAISILTGVISVPWLMAALGAEAYGLIGIYAIVQTWLQWLDAGVSLTASRQAARYRGGEVSDAQMNALVRHASVLFLAIGLVAFSALLIFQDDVLHGKQFEAKDSLGNIHLALGLMLAAAILRWLAGLYKGLLAGFGYQSTVATVNALSALARNVAVFPLLGLMGVNIQSYFLVHVAVGMLELLFSGFMVLHVLRHASTPATRSGDVFRLGWLYEIFKYSGVVALNTAAVVFVNQIDRILLLGSMTLKEFGIYSVVMSIGTVILSLGSPVASVMIPRLTSLMASGGVSAMRASYAQISVLMSILLVSTSLAAMWCASDLLTAFGVRFGDVGGSDVVLKLYLLGNAFYVMAFFPAFLCHAAGHVIFLLGANVLLGVSMSLTMYVGRSEMGAHGVAMAWCVVNAMNLILWTASVHRRYFGAVHVAPIIKLIFMPALGSCLVVSLLAFLHCLDWLRADMGFMGRWFVLVQLSVLTGAGLLAGLASLKLLAGRDKKWGIA